MCKSELDSLKQGLFTFAFILYAAVGALIWYVLLNVDGNLYFATFVAYCLTIIGIGVFVAAVKDISAKLDGYMRDETQHIFDMQKLRDDYAHQLILKENIIQQLEKQLRFANDTIHAYQTMPPRTDYPVVTTTDASSKFDPISWPTCKCDEYIRW